MNPTAAEITVARALRPLARRVGMLAAVTPINVAEERARLVEALDRGQPVLPEWRYGRADNGAVARDVGALEALLSRQLVGPLGPLYRDRTVELARELAIVDHVGTPTFAELAARRFPLDAGAGNVIAGALRATSTEHGAADEACATSDGDDPSSLASAVRALIGELRLSFRVEVRRELMPVAATGDGVVLIAAGRRLTREAVRRTAMHEVIGHALPRSRAAKQSVGLFAIGTAGGADEQEGLALYYEERANYLHGARARELAARHETVRRMRGGADFVEAVRALVAEHGLEHEPAVRVAERVYRGGDGRHGGLGREAVYLSALARVRAHLAAHPEDEIVLASGQVSVSAIESLRPWVVQSDDAPLLNSSMYLPS